MLGGTACSASRNHLQGHRPPNKAIYGPLPDSRRVIGSWRTHAQALELGLPRRARRAARHHFVALAKEKFIHLEHAPSADREAHHKVSLTVVRGSQGLFGTRRYECSLSICDADPRWPSRHHRITRRPLARSPSAAPQRPRCCSSVSAGYRRPAPAHQTR